MNYQLLTNQTCGFVYSKKSETNGVTLVKIFPIDRNANDHTFRLSQVSANIPWPKRLPLLKSSPTALPNDITTKVGWPSRFPVVQLCRRPGCGFYPPEWSNFQEGCDSKMPPMGNSPFQDRVLCDHTLMTLCSKYQIIDGKQEICHKTASKSWRRFFKALFSWSTAEWYIFTGVTPNGNMIGSVRLFPLVLICSLPSAVWCGAVHTFSHTQ